MKRFLCFCCLFMSLSLNSQMIYNYWIGFSDKNYNTFTTSQPSAFLSERSIERRQKQGIKIDQTDLPVSKYYIDSIKNIGVELLSASKWLNGVSIRTTDTFMLQRIRSLSFVKEVILTKRMSLPESSSDTLEGTQSYKLCETPIHYGESRQQMEVMKGHCLHQMGYRGKGMLIAVLDGGFFQADSFKAFTSAWQEGRIIGYRDVVNSNRDFFSTNVHGMSVTAIIAGNIPDTLIGTAPEASFLMVITEDTDTEYPIEEYNWCIGAEYADSMGADIINSSLGYNKFNDPSFNHTYEDLNGETTACARAAKYAATKGMIVVISAGNEGNKPWTKITTPADAKLCLTIGAVDSFSKYASFSSLGPTADNRVKPDICTMGNMTYTHKWDGSFYRGNGTSFSAPLAAGMTACLWQAFPDKTNFEIMNAIRQSASRYYSPNDSIGYGVADFDKAYTILNNWEVNKTMPDNLSFAPNPFKDVFRIEFQSIITEPFLLEFFDYMGILIFQTTVEPIYSSYYFFHAPASLQYGSLVGRISFPNKVYSFKIIHTR